MRREGDLEILESPGLSKLRWLVHAFSTRRGGVSEFSNPPKDEKRQPVLNLGFTDRDARQHVIENRRRFAEAIGASSMQMVTLRQVHSDIVLSVGLDQPRLRHSFTGDALLTRKPGFLLVVQTADCIPILLADNRTRAVAAVHAGWRGTIKRIAEKALGRMRMEFGTRPEDVYAALGPGIGGCCYEVGHEVAQEFAAQFPEARDWFAGPFDAIATGQDNPNWLPWLTMMPPGHAPQPPRVHLDLIAANRALLRSTGVPPENIAVSGFCTVCRADLFFSYRRERKTGRMMAAIGIL
jgi:polyphenol oxidase